MLYLFGCLALSDSLTYHENFQDSDYPEALARGQHLLIPGSAVRAATISRRLRRHRRPLAGRARTGYPNN